MLVIAILVVDCAGSEFAAQSPTATQNPSTIEPSATAVSAPIYVKGVTLVSATPGTTISSSTTMAMQIATKGGTPAPEGTTRLSLGELKYRLLHKYPNFFFCDPDFFPLSYGNEQELALARFPEIQNKTGTYRAILKHTKLRGGANLSDSQKLIVYREFKKLNALILEPSGKVYKFRLGVLTDNKGQVGPHPQGGDGLIIEGRITKMGRITVDKSNLTRLSCPICLAANTLIDTPGGPVAVQYLGKGRSVWTLDVAGHRVAAHVVQVARVRVPTTHRMVRLRLDDGRGVLASPDHPTADGRTLAQLHRGDAFDGAHVLSAERTRYADGYTYDILPSGSTGAYWANGILLGSTLRLHVASQHMRPDGNIPGDRKPGEIGQSCIESIELATAHSVLQLPIVALARLRLEVDQECRHPQWSCAIVGAPDGVLLGPSEHTSRLHMR
jgi:hypothetical protein